MRLNTLPLSKQISISSALIITAAIAVLVSSIALYTAQTARTNAELSLRMQSTALVNKLEIAYDLSRESTSRLAELFQSWFAGELRQDSTHLVPIGDKQAPVLYLNGKAITGSNALVDQFAQSTGGVATVFAKVGDDFLRVSTSLKKENGERAIGTFLDRQGAAYKQVSLGNTYAGEATLFGKRYMTQYVPVKGSSGQIEAVLFVGFQIDALYAKLKESVIKTQIGGSEAPFVLKTQGQKAGELFIHANMAPAQLMEMAQQQPELGTLLSKTSTEPNGYMELNWTDGQGKEHRNLLAFQSTPAWGGVAVVSPIGKGEVYAHVYQVIAIMVVLGALAAVLMAACLAWITSRLTSPSKALTQLALKLGNGDLTARASHEVCNTNQESKNEMNLLARSMNRMAESMENALCAVKNNAGRVQEASSQLVSSSAELEYGAAQESDAATGMASAVEQMSSSISSVGESAAHTQKVSATAKRLADEGLGAINSATVQMNQISNQVSSTSEVIGQLGEQSRQISDIALIIKGIAEQTNLLALNAAIEAARAGEQGRGFSVVADEVRKLAERTRVSTENIHSMIEGIQRSSSVAVSNMASAVDSVRLGVDLVGKAGHAMEQITHESQAVAGAVQNINEALIQQNQASGAISEKVEVVAELSDKNLHAARQATQVVGGLQSVASELTAVVGRFQVQNR